MNLRALLLVAWAAGGLVAAVCAPAPSDPRPALQASTNTVGRFEKVEFEIAVPTAYTNPFNPAEVSVSVDLRRKGAPEVSLRVPGFYYQPYERRRFGAEGRQRTWLYPAGLATWRARFASMEIGEYEAVATLTDRQGTRRSAPVGLRCVTSTHRGYIRVSARDPRFLEFSTGQPFFPIGQNLAFIGEQQYVTLARAEEIFGKLADHGANYLRLWTCCEDWAMAIEARKSAWGRSWSWRPPTAADPEDPSRKCLTLSADHATLKVDPSHPVALRPATRYALTGRIRTEGEAVLRLEAHRSRAGTPLKSAPTGGWTTFRHEFESGAGDYWLSGVTFQLEGGGSAWVNDLSLRETAGGPELLWEADVNRPVRGFYNPIDSFMLDEMVAAAERRGLYLQLCLVTRDLYMDALKDPTSADYAQAIADAKNLFRYAVARWGCSTSVAAWEYWNEMNPNLPTDRFYTELGAYLEQADPYHHLRTTSTWGPSAKDCRHAKLDLADTHFYLRPSDRERLRDEVEAVLDRTRWLREQAPDKPAHLGEFGLANEKWQPTEEMKSSQQVVDFHNAMWASALSGGTGTALFWWWDRLDPRNHYPVYRPLSAFVADVPWTSGQIRTFADTLANERVRLVGLRADAGAWFWLFDRDASWQRVVIDQQQPGEVDGLTVEIKELPAGSYDVRWWDTRAGKVVYRERAATEGTGLKLRVPKFSRDIACRVSR